MKIIHLSTSDFDGGAARAAYRIHRALVYANINSRMVVLHKETDDEYVLRGMPSSLATRVLCKLYRYLLNYTHRDWCTNNPVFHTFGQIGAGLKKKINAIEADIINLHWISNMLSVSDIGQLRKPVVWTLHDMWAFCGGEHYAPDNGEARFRRGYRRDNRPGGERGPDLSRKTWQAKTRAWRDKRFTIVSPSRWLGDCARESMLFANAAIHVIPNPLNTEWPWRPFQREAACHALDLPAEKRLILMGAYGGLEEFRKGGDLLLRALSHVTSRAPDCIELMIFGQSRPMLECALPCPVHWLGAVRDDRVLALAYSAADVMVVPSRQEAFGQTASEAQACGTPVAAFEIGGLTDIVIHRETGWLAKPFDIDALAEGILWILSDRERWGTLSRAARQRAVERFSFAVVARQYAKVYEEMLPCN